MNIYEPTLAEGYEFINCCLDADYEVFEALDGSPQGSRWNAVKVTLIRNDEGKNLAPCDFPSWPGAPALVMGKRAVDALCDILDSNGEVLPLASDDSTELFVLNAQTIDALDEEHSDIWRIPGSGRIGRIMKVAFQENALCDVDVFRLPHRGSAVYVSQRFVDRVNESGLVGLDSDLAWSSR